jgi:hypothetical protein
MAEIQIWLQEDLGDATNIKLIFFWEHSCKEESNANISQ